MTSSKRSLLVIAAIAAISSSSFAAILPANGFLLANPVAPLGGTPLLVDTSTNAFTGFDNAHNVVFTGNETTGVFSGDTNNALGGLTFVYQVNNDLTSQDALDQITLSGFAGFTADVGFIVDGQTAPVTLTRSADGDIIRFSFPGNDILQGAGSSSLVVRTNAPFDIADTMSIIDGGTGTTSSFAPAPGGGGGTPEPASVGIIGLGGLAILRRRRRV